MQYPIYIHKDPDSDYGVIVPDLPGCFSAGIHIEDAIRNAHEAIECHLEGMLIDGDPIPPVHLIEEYINDLEYQGGIWALVEIDLSKISGKSKRINVTVPERFLKQIDDYTHQHGGNRSAFLMDAAMIYLAAHR